MNLRSISLKLADYALWALALFSFISLSGSALNHIFLVVPALYFSYIAFKQKKLHWNKSTWGLLGMVVFGIISVLFAPQIGNKIKYIFKLKYLMFGILGIAAYENLFKELKRSQVGLILTIFFVLLTIGNIAGIQAYFTGYHYLRMKPAADELRAAGMYGMAITYGYGIELILIMLLGLVFNYWKRITALVNKYIILAAVVSSAAGLYFSYTRGALLALIISIPFLFIKTKKKFFYGLSVAGLFIIAGLVIAVLNVSKDNGQNRFLLKAKTKSNMIRISQYQAAIAGFKEKPLTGWGYRNFEPNVGPIKERNHIAFPDFYGHAHNNYLEFLASTGLFGFISILVFVVFWIWEVWKRNDDLGGGLFPFVISFAISGLFQNTINDGENMFVIMFIYSLSQVKRKITI